MNEQEVIKETLGDDQFKNFERQAMDSIDRMINNSFVNFMLISMFRNSNEVQKNDIAELIKVLRKDVTDVHKEKAKISFALTDKQAEVYTNTVDKVVANAFKLIENEIAIFRKVQQANI